MRDWKVEKKLIPPHKYNNNKNNTKLLKLQADVNIVTNKAWQIMTTKDNTKLAIKFI